MSVQQNHYEIIGTKFGYDEFHNGLLARMSESEMEDLIDRHWDSAFKGIQHHEGLCVICDGMNGEYVYVGHVLQKSKDWGTLGDYKNKEKAPTASKVSALIEERFGFKTRCKRQSFTHWR